MEHDNEFARHVEQALAELRAGRMVILMDDHDRENEGDLIMAAELATPEAINFMATQGRGLVCVPMALERLQALNLPLMTPDNTEAHGTAFTVSVDARVGTTTGISAADRARTVQVLADQSAKPEDLRRPGHVFPLRAVEGGVLRRVGQTEGSVDLCRLAGLKPAAVICEIMNEDGSMARLPQLQEFAEKHGLKLLHVQDIVRYRLRNETLVERVDIARMPTIFGDFKVIGYGVPVTGEHHVALVYGEIKPDEPVLVRVHSECLTGDVFGSLRCDCGPQLHYAMQRISEAGSGIVVYLRQEGRGIGLLNKIRAYHLQDDGLDTVEANVQLGFPPDKRDYGVGAQILRDLGAQQIRVMTNNPLKLVGLEAYGISIVERISIPVEDMLTAENKDYIETKRTKMGHIFSADE
jgi:3,4-dihydroxy 2-butanone 4-phosphate synthase/GTP cyclohydrolase II